MAPHILSRRYMLGSVYNYLFGARPGPASRGFATNNPVLLDSPVSLFHPRLLTVFQQLDLIAPRFATKGDNITILNLPTTFYATLKKKILSAKHRVFLSTLYVGKAQTDLVETLERALSENDGLHVLILTDALRGTRELPHHASLASLLVPLVEKFGTHRVDLRMYHTPHLSGFKQRLVPKRINETYGLQHMKLYGFDDEIMLSGANLSEDYFTDRQDRYYIFADKNIANYYFRIHRAVLSLLYQLVPNPQPHKHKNFLMTWPTANKLCEPNMNLHRFVSDALFLLEPLLKQHDLGDFDLHDDHDDYDTIVYPVSQFTPLFHHNNDASTEKPAVLRLLSYLDSPLVRWWFTAGYFNMLPQIQERLCNGHARGVVITASAKANSFYKSSGLSYYIPEAYLLIARKFLEELKNRGKDQLIKLYEWQNGVVNTPNGWLYHAKGLWVTVPDEELPSISIIGSSNFTKRAYLLDLESNALIITKHDDLKQRMKAEIDNLMVHAHPLELEDFEPKLQDSEKLDEQGNTIDHPVYKVDDDRKISYGVHLALKVFGGKL